MSKWVVNPCRLLHGLVARWGCVMALMVSLGVMGGCGDSAGRRAAADGQPIVLVSIPPLASLIEPMVQGWGHVEVILPAGASVHGYEPMADQLRTAGQADMLVVVGRNLDGWAEDLVLRAQPEAGKGALTIATFAVMLDGQAGRNVRKTGSHAHHHDHAHDHAHGHGDHDHDHSGPNAHLWLDPVLARQFVQWVLPQLQALAPDEQARAAAAAGAAALDEKLARLDAQYKDALAGVARREMVTFHNAFDLLAARYGLKVVAHMTDVDLVPGGEITSDQLIDVIRSIREHGLKVIYAEPQFSDRAIAVITRETGAKVMRLDDLGGRGVVGYEDYFQMMQTNLQTLVKGQNLP